MKHTVRLHGVIVGPSELESVEPELGPLLGGRHGLSREQVIESQRERLLVYNADDHHLIAAKIEEVNQATMKLAENMMNTAVRGALKGTKI